MSGRTSTADKFGVGKLLNMKRSAPIETSRLLRAVVLIGLQQEQYHLVYGYNSRHTN